MLVGALRDVYVLVTIDGMCLVCAWCVLGVVLGVCLVLCFKLCLSLLLLSLDVSLVMAALPLLLG